MKVKVKGAAAKVQALFKFDREIWLEMQRGVKAAVEDVSKDARARIPAVGLYSRSGAGWGLWNHNGRDFNFSQAKTRSNIKSRFKSRNVAGFREVRGLSVLEAKNNPAGAVYMLAGSRNSSGFNGVLNEQRGDGVWPRAMTPAYNAKGPQARRDLAAAVERAIAKIG